MSLPYQFVAPTIANCIGLAMTGVVAQSQNRATADSVEPVAARRSYASSQDLPTRADKRKKMTIGAPKLDSVIDAGGGGSQ
jgi:hypothetical protein